MIYNRWALDGCTPAQSFIWREWPLLINHHTLATILRDGTGKRRKNLLQQNKKENQSLEDEKSNQVLHILFTPQDIWDNWASVREHDWNVGGRSDFTWEQLEVVEVQLTCSSNTGWWHLRRSIFTSRLSASPPRVSANQYFRGRTKIWLKTSSTCAKPTAELCSPC